MKSFQIDRKQQGSHHVLLVLALVFGLVGLLGFVGYSSWMRQSSDAAGAGSLGRVTTAQKKVTKLKSELAVQLKKLSTAQKQFDNLQMTRTSLGSAVVDQENAAYNNAAKNVQKAKKALAQAKKAKDKKKIAQTKATLTRAQKLYDDASKLRQTRATYMERRASEIKNDPAKSAWSAFLAANKPAKDLKEKVKKAQTALTAAEKVYDKKDTNANKTKLDKATTTLEKFETDQATAQQKADTAYNDFEKIALTWQEYKDFIAQRKPLENARSKIESIRKTLTGLRKKIKSLHKKLQSARAELAQAKASRKPSIPGGSPGEHRDSTDPDATTGINPPANGTWAAFCKVLGRSQSGDGCSITCTDSTNKMRSPVNLYHTYERCVPKSSICKEKGGTKNCGTTRWSCPAGQLGSLSSTPKECRSTAWKQAGSCYTSSSSTMHRTIACKQYRWAATDSNWNGEGGFTGQCRIKYTTSTSSGSSVRYEVTATSGGCSN